MSWLSHRPAWWKEKNDINLNENIIYYSLKNHCCALLFIFTYKLWSYWFSLCIYPVNLNIYSSYFRIISSSACSRCLALNYSFYLSSWSLNISILVYSIFLFRSLFSIFFTMCSRLSSSMSCPDFSFYLYNFNLFLTFTYFSFELNLLKYIRSYSYDFSLYYLK